MFGFKSAKYDINLIKSCLLPIFVNKRDIELTAIIKANQFTSFKLGDVQLMDIMICLGGATSLDSFFKAYNSSETKATQPRRDHPDKLQITEIAPFDAFYSKLWSCDPLEAEYNEFFILLKSGLTPEEAVVEMKLSKPAPTGIENYQFLQQLWKQQQMRSFKLKYFLRPNSKKSCCSHFGSNAKIDCFR